MHNKANCKPREELIYLSKNTMTDCFYFVIYPLSTKDIPFSHMPVQSSRSMIIIFSDSGIVIELVIVIFT